MASLMRGRREQEKFLCVLYSFFLTKDNADLFQALLVLNQYPQSEFTEYCLQQKAFIWDEEISTYHYIYRTLNLMAPFLCVLHFVAPNLHFCALTNLVLTKKEEKIRYS